MLPDGTGVPSPVLRPCGRRATEGIAMSIAAGRASTAGPAQSRRRLLAVEPYLYALPSVVLIAAIMMVPLIIGISYAFRDIQILNPFSGGFVGLANFRTLVHDANFWNALSNTFYWTVISVVLQFVFGLILALLLN